MFNMPHVIGTLELALVEVWKIKYYLRMSAGRVPWYYASSLCGIFMIVSIETGGPRIAWDPR